MNDSDPPVNFDMEQQIEALENDENDIILNNARADTARKILIDTYFSRFVIFLKLYIKRILFLIFNIFIFIF